MSMPNGYALSTARDPMLHDLFDLDALARTELFDSPYQHLVVPGFLRPAAFEAVHDDFPDVDDRGPFDPTERPAGPAFVQMLEALTSAEMATHFARRFGDDILEAPTLLKARRYDDPDAGGIHTDAKGKLVTVLIYLNPSWTTLNGCLRILRSGRDIEDYAAEVPPLGGTLVAFRRTDYSFHGYLHSPGERRMVQMNYVKPKKAARGTVDKHDTGQRANRAKRWMKRLVRHLRAR